MAANVELSAVLMSETRQKKQKLLAVHPLRLLLAVERVEPYERHSNWIDGRSRSHVVPLLETSR
jgi:hypothetical protein